MLKIIRHNVLLVAFGLASSAVLFFTLTHQATAASFTVSPASGNYTVGSTFSVTVSLNTEGENVNAVEVALSFPPDKLQLASPSTGNSIIDIYTTQPKFNNQTGRVDIAGGIPGGINVKNGLITTLTFRVEAVGPASVRFLDNSKALLNDGKGTDVLRGTVNGNFTLGLPPPGGPEVSSDTHADQTKFYSNRTVILKWKPVDGATGYSYIMSSEPIDLPDDIVDSQQTSVIYRNIGDGVHYFHIKAYSHGVWGGITHFSVKVDVTPPAEFPIEISPDSRTLSRRPFIEFATTDGLSGLDHYELKIVPLSQGASQQQLFIEAQSPYAPPGDLALGSYDVIVRAYDKAGNFRDVTQSLLISNTIFRFFSSQGIEIRKKLTLSWPMIGLLFLLLLAALFFLAWRMRKWHHKADWRRSPHVLPGSLKNQLEELKKYRRRYGKLAAVVVLALTSVLATSLLGVHKSYAQLQEATPPSITSYSHTITDEEIFYVGGRTQDPDTSVVIHLQNLYDGQTFSFSSQSDKRGDWFYRHNSFLSGGNYVVWTQSKLGDQLSPPSPQVQMTVRPIALRFGSSRVTYNTVYLTAISVLSTLSLLLIAYILFHAIAGRRKRRRFAEEVKEANRSITDGFAQLHKDLTAELSLIKRTQMTAELSAEEKVRAEELENDLRQIESYVKGEISQVQRFEGV